jgi:hypothetical protein
MVSGLEELEPRSLSTRDWEGEVMFSDEDVSADDERVNRRFRRRIKRAIEGLRADVAGLREDMDLLRSGAPSGRQKDGIIMTLGKWVFRFVGVRQHLSCRQTNVQFLLRHALFDVFIVVLVWTWLYRRGDDRARLWARVFSEWIRRRLVSRGGRTTAEVMRNRSL